MLPMLVLRSCSPDGPEAGSSGPMGLLPAGQERDAVRLLDRAELERAAAMMPGPRSVFLAGRLAQRSFAAGLLEVPASELRAWYSCPRCGTGPQVSHGRPGYAYKESPVPLLLSLSRSAGWVLLAAVIDPEPGQRLGIDVEDPGRLTFDGFDAVALAPAERLTIRGLSGRALLRERARLWVRKEAWLKMTGEGLRTDPKSLDVLERAGLRDLSPAETGLPPELPAAVALSDSERPASGAPPVSP